MSQKHILDVASKLAVAPLKRSDGGHGAAQDNFYSAIANLENILSTGEANADTTAAVEKHIDNLRQFENLGVIIGGKFRPIAASIVASSQGAIKPGVFISGMRFLVVTEELSRWFFSEKDEAPPSWFLSCKDLAWDNDTESMLHASYWYRRHPEATIPPFHISKYNLEEFELEKRMNAGV